MKPLVKLALLLVFCTQAWGTWHDELPVELQLKDLSGADQSLSMYRGKVVVLNFWATWCEPCEEEMHDFVDANKKFSRQDLVILAASLDDATSQKNVPKFVKQEKMAFPVLVGATTDHLHQLGLGEGVPGTVFLNRDGKIVARVLGQIKKKELKERIEWALANSAEYPVPVLDHFAKH